MATPAFSEESGGETALAQEIRARILSQGPIPFREFMATALYDPTHGYYAGETQRVGKEGDFITSVSAGRCFGLILARRLASYWREIGSPSEFHIIEPGAHDGALCYDILSEAKTTQTDFYKALHYHLIETTPLLRSRQKTKLSPEFSDKFSCHASITDIQQVTGAVLSNELLDAFPVDIVRYQDGKWHQLTVGLDSHSQFTFVAAPLSDQLAEFCRDLENNGFYPEGYTTEFNPGIKPFVREVANVLTRGLMITVDYGHHSEDYYHPDRTEGTLQTYYQHQKSDNPLTAPGEIDITCHVDFTRLENEASAVGFKLVSLGTQASYLTNHAKHWLLELEKVMTPETPTLLRQFQTLTHPAMLGTRFMVLEMERTVEK
ncbi:SAM-dependent methyltransferase [Oceaniferula spumae]|uniref:SAM-dependent methyltransferase n=1 Tax=Oceaniferula spumae TaxID=2979115 RepID=A0AAT9FRY3_9BACT